MFDGDALLKILLLLLLLLLFNFTLYHFLSQNYRSKSVGTQIFYDAGLAPKHWSKAPPPTRIELAQHPLVRVQSVML